MSPLEWNESLQLGVTEMDCEHKRLVGLVNQLENALQVGDTQEKLIKAFDDLVVYTRNHFASEDRFLQSTGCRDLAQRAQAHGAFMENVQAMHQAFHERREQVSPETVAYLKSWTLAHITEQDAKYAQDLLQTA